MPSAAITIDVSPTVELGPLSLAWHGMMIAIGILAGGWLARRYARERGLDSDRLLDAVLVLVVSGIVGARLFYLLENDAAALLRPGDWLGTEGFAFYGGMIGGASAVALYLRRRRLSISYLDAMAVGFPLGMAVGRIGDVINGEHFGPASDVPWAIRWAHPDAEAPATALAYHSGGLYEVVLALAMLAVVWPLRHRLRRPGLLLATVVALYSAGRFAMFFYRSDSDALAIGLSGAQWTSLALFIIAVIGAWWSIAQARGDRRLSGRPLPPSLGS